MFTLIYNPIAGNRRAERVLPRVTEELKRRSIDFVTLETVFPEDKTHYAHVPCSAQDTVCIIGGDGTVLNVLNQLPARTMRLITVPSGTGNDFIKCLHLPKDPIKAFRRQLDAPPRLIDYALASGEVFLNVFGIGFDVEVLKKLDQFKRKHAGLKAYLFALVKAISEYKPHTCMVSVDGGAFRKCVFSILSAGNGQYIGGGMKAVPQADVSDGLLNVVEVKPVKKRHLLILLPLFIFGFHVKARLGKMYRCRTLTIKGENLSYEIDGEIRSADTIHLSLVSGELTFSH